MFLRDKVKRVQTEVRTEEEETFLNDTGLERNEELRLIYVK